MHDLESHRLVLVGDDPHSGDPDPQRPRAQRDRGSTRPPAHGELPVGAQCEALATAARQRSIARRPDGCPAACARRASQYEPCGVEYALEHGGVRLGEAGPDHRQQRLGVGAAVVDLAGERALDHRDEPGGAQVAAAAIAPTPPMQPAGTRTCRRRRAPEAGRRTRQHFERVGVERADGLLYPGDVRDVRPPRAGRRRRGRAPCASGCCTRSRTPARFGDTRKCSTIAASRWAGRNTARPRACRPRPGCLRSPGRGGSSTWCCSVPVPTISGAPVPCTRASDCVDHRLLLVGVERGRLARGAQRDDPADAVGEILAAVAARSRRRRRHPARRTA